MAVNVNTTNQPSPCARACKLWLFGLALMYQTYKCLPHRHNRLWALTKWSLSLLSSWEATISAAPPRGHRINGTTPIVTSTENSPSTIEVTAACDRQAKSLFFRTLLTTEPCTLEVSTFRKYEVSNIHECNRNCQNRSP